MNINLLTDAPKHNLQLMKMSTFYKHTGHKVHLNGVGKFDYTVGSWLFNFSEKGICDIEGGPGVNPEIRNDEYDKYRPDYSLFNLNYSLGFTWSYCPRQCPFCIVPKQKNPKEHKSIWAFHKAEFKEICLLNNNTFTDPQWKETFEEIWDAKLIVRDENGYDLRLIDEGKALALKKTEFSTPLHFAWDLMEDEKEVIRGLEEINRVRLRSTANEVYVLIGYNTTRDEDIYRCQKINDYGLTPYPMPFKKTSDNMKFKRFINLHFYRKYKTIEDAWQDYNP